ncbi:hypothetical protein V8G54_036375 [Vigna mungo]|uniref:Small ribosomal subunit protein uS14m n=1 Tax=Vigna mungo TaxID=3915 RepID=A0AAQ3MH59_VIGMU
MAGCTLAVTFIALQSHSRFTLPHLQGKSFRSNPFLGSKKDKGYVSDLARQSTLRGHGMSNFSVRISTVMSLLDSPVEIRENSIQFSMETEFCEFSPELEDHFEIFEHIRGFNVTIVTSANTQDETLPPWSGFLQKDEGETQLLAAKYELRRKLYKAFCKDSDLPSDMRDKLRYKFSKLPRNSSFARVRNRCISTGRPRSVYEFFRISRIVFRGLASREIVLVATAKPIEQGLALQLVHKQGNNPLSRIGDAMLTGLESKWGTYLPPVSISCQVCSPDIDYVQGITNVTPEGSTTILNKVRRRTVVHWSAGVRRLFPSWNSVGLSLPRKKSGPTPLFPPFMKDPRPPRFLFIFGSGPEGLFFSRGDFENQPTDKSVAQVTHSLPLAQRKWDEFKKKKLFD